MTEKDAKSAKKDHKRPRHLLSHKSSKWGSIVSRIRNGKTNVGQSEQKNGWRINRVLAFYKAKGEKLKSEKRG